MSVLGAKKWIYGFGGGAAEGHAGLKALLGGKGANLAEMSRLGLPVPPGFTITTEACAAFFAGEGWPAGLEEEAGAHLARVEELTGRRFGDPGNPLLVSVRSGARASMPGMMDTVLDLGLNDETAEALARQTGDMRFAYDSYRRFIQMYSDVVLGVDHHHFEEILDIHKQGLGGVSDSGLSGEDWREVTQFYKEKVAEVLSRPFPQLPREQLLGAIGAVFHSWNNSRARAYRRLHNIPDGWGTAVSVQAMVFGNRGRASATGVAFTRDPSTGENCLYGEFLINAQGEDVVAGMRTPRHLTRAGREKTGAAEASMEEAMPEIFAGLSGICGRLERHYRDMQDVEFTIEEGRLWMLQTRSGKRSAAAAIRMAAEMVREGLISEEEALERISPSSLDQLLHPTLDPAAERDVVTRGLPASPGAASGEVVFTPAEAEELVQQGRKVILVRLETSPEDIHGMHAARGILTARGGMTSHAAVVARGMGRPCVSGASGIRLDPDGQGFQAGDRRVARGDVITIDGTTGEVMWGAVRELPPALSEDFERIMGWADKVRRLRVRANAETAADAKMARLFGAEGIGLCRTEHMFFDAERITAMRAMILADDVEGRRKALARLLPMQRGDFAALFAIMPGLPVTIRLLDPPLHEFLPRPEEAGPVARALDVEEAHIRRRLGQLSEANPMLGHRGCRLGITYPEIYEMQVQAIMEAVAAAGKEAEPIIPEIMIPLVASKAELDFVKERVEAAARGVCARLGQRLAWRIGTMIELPRAALCAEEIARSADFFSFGTNDLTQTAFGISRDDSGGFMNVYTQSGIFAHDPFVTIDRRGVGALVRLACERGRAGRADLKLGICGEHGGDPASILFFEEAQLDYVSCSPYRVPIARLAAAQAVLAGRKAREEADG